MTHNAQSTIWHEPTRGRRRSAGRMVVIMTFAAIVFTLLPERAAAQLIVESRRDLVFGLLIPGVATAVLPTNRQGAGLFRIRGPRNTEFEVLMVLPTEMVAAVGGFKIPLSFGAGDAAWTRASNPGGAVLFDPNLPQTFLIQNPPMINIFIGGTATPAANQRGGDYQGTITLIIATVSS